MSLYGYQKKTRPAMWQLANPVPRPERKKFKRAQYKSIRSVSKAKAADFRKYKERAMFFVSAARELGEVDEVVHTVAELKRKDDTLTECHHFYGRCGRLLLAEWGWHARSAIGHQWIHNHITEARRLGYICEAGLWNNYEAARLDAIKRGWLKAERGECSMCGYKIDPSCELCGECSCETEGND